MTENVRGAILPMGGVAAVATDPLGRRKGYARLVLRGLFERMRERGQPVSVLYPLRPTFYGRLGYASLPPRRVIDLGPASLAPLLRQEIDGDFTLTTLADGAESYTAFLRRLQSTTHGLALFPPKRTAVIAGRRARWLLTAQIGGEVAGAMLYRTSGDDHGMDIDDFLFVDSHGKYLLLQWLARHVDHVRKARIQLGPGDLLETWLDDLDATIHSAYSLHGYYEPMGRVVSIDGLIGLSAGPGRFAARIIDQHCPWTEGVHTFAGEDGQLLVGRGGAAECDLTIQGLSALVYAGHDPADFRFRGWGDPPPATQAAMRSLFPPALPNVLADF
jgi:hypothetical protein